MRNIFFLSLLLSIPSAVSAQVLSFITNDFKSFVNHVIPAPQRGKFASYYKNLDAKIAQKNPSEQQKLRHHYYQTALQSLQEDHRGWSDKINEFLSNVAYLDSVYDNERHALGQYLYWYGAYEEFQVSMHLKEPVKPSESKKFFDNVRLQLSKASHKVGEWFKSLKTKLT